jgi:hypothetical protein
VCDLGQDWVCDGEKTTHLERNLANFGLLTQVLFLTPAQLSHSHCYVVEVYLPLHSGVLSFCQMIRDLFPNEIGYCVSFRSMFLLISQLRKGVDKHQKRRIVANIGIIGRKKINVEM